MNGDTVYVMGNFKDFKMDDHSNVTWDEQNAMTSTAVCISPFPDFWVLKCMTTKLRLNFALQDYIASIDSVTQSHSNIK